MKLEKFKSEKIEKLDMVKGGSEPIPAAEATLEQATGNPPVSFSHGEKIDFFSNI